jgi:chromatin remodeling complex protein RSC6
VELEVDWQPERFTLSDGLAIMLGIQNDTRENILKV